MGDVRGNFPVTTTGVYLDHAAAGPISVPVARAVRKALAEQLQGGLRATSAWPGRFDRVRARAASIVNGDAARVAFVQNTSVGLSLAANGLTWREGDNVVVPEREFPSNVYPWTRLGDLGVEVRLVPAPAGQADVGDLADAIDSRTRVLSVSAVQFSTGYRYPLHALGELCRRRDVLFVVDGTQAVGAMSVDVERDNVDLLAVSAHKWLLGPHGIGFVHLSARAMELLSPSVLGWLSVADPFAMDNECVLAPDARRFEAGTANGLGILGLGACLDLVEEVGVSTIESQVLAVTDELRRRLVAAGLSVLSPSPPATRSGIVVFAHPAEEAVTVHRRLTAAGVQCSVRGGGIRLSPHYYTTDAEIMVAVGAASGRP